MAQSAASRERKITSLIAEWPHLASLGARCIEDGTSYSDAQRLFLAAIAREQNPYRSSGIEVGDCLSHNPAWRSAAADYLILRSNGRLIGSMSDSERARRTAAAEEAGGACGSADGILTGVIKKSMRGPHDAQGNKDFWSRALSHTSSDFPSILHDGFSKALQGFFAAIPQNYSAISRTRNVPDFKAINAIKVGDSGSLIATPDLVPVPGGTHVDSKESYFLTTYARSVGIGRQAIMSDDLSAFSALAELHAQAASRLVSDLVFSLLTSASGVGPTMAEDGKALFATDHTSGANYATGSATPDATGIAVLCALLRKQKGFCASIETAPTMNIRPYALLVPSALEGIGRSSCGTFSNAEADDSNPAFVGNLKLLVESRLDGGTNGATAFYVIGDPASTPGLEIAYLRGRDRPTLTEAPGNSPLGLSFNIVFDVACKFTEHRGWTRHKGVA